MACGVCASWVLVFPVYILFSVVVIAYFLKIKLRREALYLGFATLGAVLIGLILLHKSTLGGISTDTLSVGGGLPQTFDDLFVTATVVFGIIYLAKNKIFAKNTVNAFALLLGSVLIGVVVLKLYFLVQGYELSYYYTKFSYILTVLCAVILFATVAIWTEGRKYASLPIATAALFLIGTYGSNFTSMTHWAQYINTSQYLSGSVSEVILHEFSKPYNKDGQYIYAVYDGEPGVAEIFSRLVNINKYKNENDCTNDMRQVRGSMEDSKRVKIEKSCPGVILSLNDGAIYK